MYLFKAPFKVHQHNYSHSRVVSNTDLEPHLAKENVLEEQPYSVEDIVLSKDYTILLCKIVGIFGLIIM